MHAEVTRRLRQDPVFLIGSGLALLFILTSVLGPLFSPFDPWNISFDPLSPPSARHLLGVNDGGQDIFSELLFAIRNSLSFGLVSGSAALILGVCVGVFSGWLGGIADAVLMRIADILLAIPAVMVLILVAALFRPSPLSLALMLSVLAWPTIAKAIRAQTLTLKQGLAIRAASQMGGGTLYVIGRHLLPEMFPLYIIGFAAKTRMAIFMEASLAFLGLFDPARKSLGLMIAYALKYYYMNIWWNWLMPPIICLSLLIMSVAFVAISLEKVLDPRLREPVVEGAI